MKQNQLMSMINDYENGLGMLIAGMMRDPDTNKSWLRQANRRVPEALRLLKLSVDARGL